MTLVRKSSWFKVLQWFAQKLGKGRFIPGSHTQQVESCKIKTTGKPCGRILAIVSEDKSKVKLHLPPLCCLLHPFMMWWRAMRNRVLLNATVPLQDVNSSPPWTRLWDRGVMWLSLLALGWERLHISAVLGFVWTECNIISLHHITHWGQRRLLTDLLIQQLACEDEPGALAKGHKLTCMLMLAARL